MTTSFMEMLGTETLWSTYDIHDSQDAPRCMNGILSFDSLLFYRLGFIVYLVTRLLHIQLFACIVIVCLSLRMCRTSVGSDTGKGMWSVQFPTFFRVRGNIYLGLDAMESSTYLTPLPSPSPYFSSFPDRCAVSFHAYPSPASSLSSLCLLRLPPSSTPPIPILARPRS